MDNVSILQGKPFSFTPMRLPNEAVLLDPKNPRVQYMVGQAGGSATQEELDALLWRKEQVKALAQSIFQNGGVREPIIVQRSEDGRYVVREGNCRTVSNKHLAEQYPGDTRFSHIPAHVYDQTLSEEDVAVLLADMHVAKKISWDAYEQAKYIHDLSVVYGKTYEWLSNHLRLSKGKISEQLSAYRATTDYLDRHPGPSNIRKFSLFQEIMKKKDLRDQFESSPTFRDRVYSWIEGDLITDARQIRELPEVLKNAAAEEALDNEGFEAARKVLVTDDPSRGSELFQAIKHATEALKVAPATDIRDLKEGHVQKIIMLRNLSREIENLGLLAGVKL